MFENFLNNFYLENSKKIKIYTLKTIHIIHIPTNKTTKHWFKKQCSAFSVLFLNQRQFMQKSWDSVQTIHLGWWLLPRKSFLWFFYIIPLVFLKSRASLEQAGFCHLKRHISIHIAWWLVMKSFPMFLHNFLIFFFGMLICYFIQFSEHGLKRDHLCTPRMMTSLAEALPYIVFHIIHPWPPWRVRNSLERWYSRRVRASLEHCSAISFNSLITGWEDNISI